MSRKCFRLFLFRLKPSMFQVKHMKSAGDVLEEGIDDVEAPTARVELSGAESLKKQQKWGLDHLYSLSLPRQTSPQML